MKRSFAIAYLCSLISLCSAQSFEVMPGSENIFIDAQYLKFFDTDNRISLFSRTRATAEYDQQTTDLFTGAYLNYTIKYGIGVTGLGRIASNGAGIDAGIHYFRAAKSIMVYALPSVNISNELFYSWFSIFRFTPALKQNWRLYSSLELFSAFGQEGHLSSVQRIRLGADFKGYQFGPALNLREMPTDKAEISAGIFFRKQF